MSNRDNTAKKKTVPNHTKYVIKNKLLNFSLRK